MAMTREVKKIYLSEKNDGFMKKSKDDFTFDNLDEAKKYLWQLQLLLLPNPKIFNRFGDIEKIPNNTIIMEEIRSMTKFIRVQENKIVKNNEPNYDNITVNSFNKSAAGI